MTTLAESITAPVINNTDTSDDMYTLNIEIDLFDVKYLYDINSTSEIH